MHRDHLNNLPVQAIEGGEPSAAYGRLLPGTAGFRIQVPDGSLYT